MNSRAKPFETMCTTLEPVFAYADGIAAYPSGPGAYATTVVTPVTRSLEAHAYRHTTRDRMAIVAATAALRQCPAGSKVELSLDNRRVFDAIRDGKLEQWRGDDWKACVGRRPIKDGDLWRQLDAALLDRSVSINWASDCDEEFVECVRRAKIATRLSLKHIDTGYRRRSASASRDLPRRARPTRRLTKGDPCPRCQTAVTQRPAKGQVRRAGQRFYWSWILRCDGCGARFQTREGRRRIEVPVSDSPAP